MRRTKLVCTIGPSSAGRLDELVAAGMDVARLNFSHGTAAEHASAAAEIQAVAERAGRPVAILADLPGPKVRLGQLPGGELELETGGRLVLVPEDESVGGDRASVSYPGLARDVESGDRLMLADGAVELRVVASKGRAVHCDVVRGGTVRSGAGLNVPSQRLALPAVTDRDRESLQTVMEIGADYVAQSFVRNADDVRELRSLMGDRPLPIMVKLETRAGVENLSDILEAADALMLARGDLGVEIPFPDVPLIQKQVIRASVAAGVPVVVATQMLESMVTTPRPTRAEASDVANAVLDGADAVMLSAETAIGAYPVLSAEAAAAICVAAEADPEMTYHLRPDALTGGGDAAKIAFAALDLVRNGNGPRVSAIACFTRSGLTARLLARLRPGCPITALSPDPAVVRRMALLRAVSPVLADQPEDTDEMIQLLDRSLRDTGLAAGTPVALVASIPFGAATTNFLKLHRLGS